MHEFVVGKCLLIAESIEAIEEYLQSVQSRDELKKRKNRVFLDAIMMRLQSVGENIKKITAINPAFFTQTLQPDIIPIIRFRDFISHHYERIDSDIVFDICKHSIPLLKEEIIQIINKNKFE